MVLKRKSNVIVSVLLGIVLTGCLMPPGAKTMIREEVGDCIAPKAKPTVMHLQKDIDWPTAKCRKTAETLLSKMSLDEKIGQMVQPDRGHLRNDLDVGSYGIGSVLNGGSTDPSGGNDAVSWANMVAKMQTISLSGKHGIPILYGIDAVHGHSNVHGTVLFPHNIGLGCARDADLMERIGRVTAAEMAATGIDWTFAPVLAAARDERWGRTYEAFGETPELAAELASAMIRGLQGEQLGAGETSVLACAKHFAGDGGTNKGADQGNTVGSMEEIRKLHVDQYLPAVKAKVGSIMASYSSVNTVKLHCHGGLLTDVLKEEMGFNGFVISDWQAVEKLPGQYREQVASAINGGVDMIMAPEAYVGTINTIEKMVPNTIPEERIDDAVGRILSVKCEMGMFNPSHWRRDAAGAVTTKPELLRQVGAPEHRQVAREAVRKSLVLLKNENQVLPLKKEKIRRIHVTGKNADDLGNQCGGWTISWQGSGGHVTKGTNILQSIRKATEMQGPGGKRLEVTTSGSPEGADVGIVVIGETPYAEGNGDRDDLSLDREDLAAVADMKSAGIPVVVILISGRPMILGPVLDQADALVAAWLPGTEGLGVSDVLFGDYDFTGKLGHSWPRNMTQIPINVGDSNYDPLFPYGFGLTYSTTPSDTDTHNAGAQDGQDMEETVGTPPSTDGDDGQSQEALVDGNAPVPAVPPAATATVSEEKQPVEE